MRNDRLGDFALSLPCYSALKQNMPEAHLSAFVPLYTQSLADCYPDIDSTIVDTGSVWQLAQTLRKERFDAVIVLFSTMRIALATLLAGIPRRTAPKTKLAQFFLVLASPLSLLLAVVYPFQEVRIVSPAASSYRK